MSENEDVTQLLNAWSRGEDSAADELFPVVYRELEQIAQRVFSDERSGHTLEPSALLHEAYMRLTGQQVEWQNRTHFYSLAATMMRRVLIDHARRRTRKKRGGVAAAVTLNDSDLPFPALNLDLLALEAALEKLQEIDPLSVKIVEQRFFAGLSLDDTAVALDVSRATVVRHWRMTRAWLFRELKPTEAEAEVGTPDDPRQTERSS